MVKSLSPETWNSLAKQLGIFIPEKYRILNFGDKIHKAAALLELQSRSSMYDHLISHWKDPSTVVPGSNPEIHCGLQGIDDYHHLSFQEEMMLLDTLTYLPDDILVKVDRAAMACSLETRVPFLDVEIVEYCANMHHSFKIRNGEGKWALRQLLGRRLPLNAFQRPKAGFGVPLASWLRGPLREWADSLLCPSRLKSHGFFDEQTITSMWLEHSKNQRDWHYYLWDVLMFEAWHDEFVSK
jgi:asparagine synthase (glutamine-hydrolysing)